MSMTVIEHIELASDQATIVVDDIPQTYTDLYLVFSGRTSISDNIGYGIMSINGSTANVSGRFLQGRPGTVGSGTDTPGINAFVSGGNTTANTFGSFSLYIPNYTSSNAKSFSIDLVTENNSGASFAAFQRITAGLFNSSAAVTSIEFDADAATNYKQYSSVTLYGITAGSDGTTIVS
jgi:hypothetical protein